MSEHHLTRRNALLAAAAGLAAVPLAAGRGLAADPTPASSHFGNVKVYLDPGHGGSDSGAVGNGLREKDVTLDLALRLNHILVVTYGFQTRLSRSSDITRSLRSRTSDANSWGAHVFVSIHINSAGGTAGTGFESYRHPNAPWWTVFRHAWLHDETIRQMRTVASVRDRGKKTANFFVLRETAMSAILTENMFINNPSDAALLRRNDFRHAIATGHARGIVRMFS